MDALRTIPTGFENVQNVQNVQNARAAEAVVPQRERDGAQSQSARLERAQPSVQVNLSETARAAARSDSPPASASTPAAPVQTQEAVSRANSTGSVESRDTAASTAAGREAVQRYMENAANKLPAGQSGPSAVRVSA